MTFRTCVAHASALVLVALAACGSPQPGADSAMALRPPDTVKPAPVSTVGPAGGLTDTTSAAARAGRDTVSPAKAGGTTRPARTSTRTGSVTGSGRTDTAANPVIGRDSVIRFDMKNPRRRLPVDTQDTSGMR